MEVPLQGLFVVTSSPVFIAYLFVSWLNQLVRKCNMGKKLDEEEKKLMFTQLASHLLNRARNWEWSGVLKCGIVWGYVYMVRLTRFPCPASVSVPPGLTAWS